MCYLKGTVAAGGALHSCFSLFCAPLNLLAGIALWSLSAEVESFLPPLSALFVWQFEELRTPLSVGAAGFSHTSLTPPIF